MQLDGCISEHSLHWEEIWLKVRNQLFKTKCESHMTDLLAAFKEALLSCSQKVGNAEDQAQHHIVRGPSSRADVLSITRSVMQRLGPRLGKNRIQSTGEGTHG